MLFVCQHCPPFVFSTMRAKFCDLRLRIALCITTGPLQLKPIQLNLFGELWFLRAAFLKHRPGRPASSPVQPCQCLRPLFTTTMGRSPCLCNWRWKHWGRRWWAKKASYTVQKSTPGSPTNTSTPSWGNFCTAAAGCNNRPTVTGLGATAVISMSGNSCAQIHISAQGDARWIVRFGPTESGP